MIRNGIGACLVVMATTARAAAPTESVDEALRQVFPALVRIHVVAAYYSDGREVKGESVGSGAIISAAGHVITNHHVAGAARRITCTLADKRELEATLVGTDPLTDISVLKLTGVAALPVARFGDSDALRVGEPVMAMGSPLALSQSVTLGIVSNIEMTFPQLLGSTGFELDGEDVGALVRWIGHDAQIFPGNSGGPLVNRAGEIVGINEISYGLSGAIPSNLARQVAEEIIQHGSVRRSWLGLGLQPLLGDGTAPGGGALVASVVHDSPAAVAGLKPGDVLLTVAGQPVDVHYPEQIPALNRLMLSQPAGTPLTLEYKREGKLQSARPIPRERGAARGREIEARSWGVTLQDITLLSGNELGRASGSGAMIGSIRVGGPAAEAKPALQTKDVVVAVAGQKVATAADLLAATERVLAGAHAAVPTLVTFERNQERLLTVLRLGGREDVDRSAEATKAWLPASTQVLTPDLAGLLGIPGGKGVRVTQVYAGSSAEHAGLRVGDVLQRLNGDPIAASQPEDAEVLSSMVRQYAVGAAVKLDLIRDGKPLALSVELAASPRKPRELVEYKDSTFDFSARDLTFEDSLAETPASGSKGVLVTRVERGGWAALGHLAVGDVVLSVDGLQVSSLAEFESLLRRTELGRAAVFLVRRRTRTLFLELAPAR